MNAMARYLTLLLLIHAPVLLAQDAPEQSEIILEEASTQEHVIPDPEIPVSTPLPLSRRSKHPNLRRGRHVRMPCGICCATADWMRSIARSTNSNMTIRSGVRRHGWNYWRPRRVNDARSTQCAMIPPPWWRWRTATLPASAVAK